MIPVYYITAEVYLHIKFSGSPFINDEIEKKCNYT